jgi:hypothetical protein
MYPLIIYDQVIYYCYQEVQAERKMIKLFFNEKTKIKIFTSGGPLNEYA